MHPFQQTTRAAATSAAAIAVLIAIVLQTGGSSASAMQAGVINDADLVFPIVKIVRLGDTIVRLDTSTGEMSRFLGTISGSGATGRWTRMVRPLATNTSGLLDVQQIGGGTFLIDLDNGNTWLLRRSGATLGTWMPIQKS